MIDFSVFFAMYIYIYSSFIDIYFGPKIYIQHQMIQHRKKNKNLFYVRVTVRKNLLKYFFFSIMVLQNLFGTSLILSRRNKIHLAIDQLLNRKKKSNIETSLVQIISILHINGYYTNMIY